MQTAETAFYGRFFKQLVALRVNRVRVPDGLLLSSARICFISPVSCLQHEICSLMRHLHLHQSSSVYLQVCLSVPFKNDRYQGMEA